MFIDLKIFSIILDVSAIFKLDAETTFLEIFSYEPYRATCSLMNTLSIFLGNIQIILYSVSYF